MSKELTVKELAEREQVAERTVRRWIDKGAVHIRRTPGGGIRIVERRQSVTIISTQEDTGRG